MPGVQKIDISSSTIFRILLIILGAWLLYLVREVIIMILAAVVISSAIEPLARRLQRYKIPRAASAVIVYVTGLVIIGGAIAIILPALAQQLVQLAQALPHLVEGFQQRFSIGGDSGTLIVPELQQGLQQIGENITNFTGALFRQTRNLFATVFSVLFVLIIAFYLVLEEDALKKLFRIIIPRDHVPYVERVIDRVQHKLGRWVLAQLSLGVVIGVSVGLGLWAMGVPFALALGLLAGVLEIIPIIGPIIAGVFAVAVALSQSFLLALGVLVFYVIVQQLENHVLIPNLMRKATGLNPVVTIIAVLLGGRLAGTVGIILSVPVATILSIFLSDFFSTTSAIEEKAAK
ncbi:MAG: AI-2E family transporter [Candidatus Andersenbacteria bacterium]